jgi:Transmembrane adaptor Erv26
MWILPLVGYIGLGLGFGFLTLAIGTFPLVSRSWHMLTSPTASGLYYLSELVEEHTVFAKKLLTRLIYAVISIQILLCLIDGFPFGLSLLSIVSHVVYLGNMRRFPIVKLSDPLFITSCGTDMAPDFTMSIC